MLDDAGGGFEACSAGIHNDMIQYRIVPVDVVVVSEVGGPASVTFLNQFYGLFTGTQVVPFQDDLDAFLHGSHGADMQRIGDIPKDGLAPSAYDDYPVPFPESIDGGLKKSEIVPLVQKMFFLADRRVVGQKRGRYFLGKLQPPQHGGGRRNRPRRHDQAVDESFDRAMRLLVEFFDFRFGHIGFSRDFRDEVFVHEVAAENFRCPTGDQISNTAELA